MYARRPTGCVWDSQYNIYKRSRLIHTILKFGSAAKDPKFAFAITMDWENSINSAVRRIYSRQLKLLGRRTHFAQKQRNRHFRFIKNLGSKSRKWH